MGYSNYKSLKQALKRLQINENSINLFPVIEEVLPSDWLKMSLFMADEMPLTNEKSKSERLISPILLEISVKGAVEPIVLKLNAVAVIEEQVPAITTSIPITWLLVLPENTVEVTF